MINFNIAKMDTCIIVVVGLFVVAGGVCLFVCLFVCFLFVFVGVSDIVANNLSTVTC